MKVYVDANNCEVYTEETIDKEITDRLERCDYYGLYEYMADNICEADIFAMLPPDIQSQIFEYFKKEILDNEFCIQYIDEPLPCNRCPFVK